MTHWSAAEQPAAPECLRVSSGHPSAELPSAAPAPWVPFINVLISPAAEPAMTHPQGVPWGPPPRSQPPLAGGRCSSGPPVGLPHPNPSGERQWQQKGLQGLMAPILPFFPRAPSAVISSLCNRLSQDLLPGIKLHAGFWRSGLGIP